MKQISKQEATKKLQRRGNNYQKRVNGKYKSDDRDSNNDLKKPPMTEMNNWTEMKFGDGQNETEHKIA